uniref:Uncharacterized protein n=1 Tax=Euplotes harpa TaxID=151035 RepID=A0A7S3JG83_9SPIT|mmetsp:Transcript_34440/g.39832  ORF Transcript_34440/g.39832 Transcript_34440/m.39832 type:complete len:114 (+) Transcript_34440:1361-1702(+)
MIRGHVNTKMLKRKNQHLSQSSFSRQLKTTDLTNSIALKMSAKNEGNLSNEYIAEKIAHSKDEYSGLSSMPSSQSSFKQSLTAMKARTNKKRLAEKIAAMGVSIRTKHKNKKV